MGVCTSALFALVRRDLPVGSRPGVVLICGAFTVSLCVACAIGRTCSGLETVVSRYTSFLIPGFLAVYYAIWSVKAPRLRKALVTAYLAVAVGAVFPLTAIERAEFDDFRAWKQRWIDCYRLHESVSRCNSETQPIFPPHVDVQLEWQLQELKRRRLSFFADGE